MKRKLSSAMVALAMLFAAVAVQARDVMLFVYTVIASSTPTERGAAATTALAIYINAGGTFDPASDDLYIMYFNSSLNIQERMNVATVNGQLIATATGEFGRFATMTVQGGGGGACDPNAAGINTLEQGHWQSYTVCDPSGCGTGAHWISTGITVLPETMGPAECYF